jgi:hypothetical protein
MMAPPVHNHLICSNRWNNAGPACILWRLSYDSVTGAGDIGTSSRNIVSHWTYDQVLLASYGGSVDLWPVPPPSTFRALRLARCFFFCLALRL